MKEPYWLWLSNHRHLYIIIIIIIFDYINIHFVNKLKKVKKITLYSVYFLHSSEFKLYTFSDHLLLWQIHLLLIIKLLFNI